VEQNVVQLEADADEEESRRHVLALVELGLDLIQHTEMICKQTNKKTNKQASQQGNKATNARWTVDN
jgi:hypothetical protein